MATCFHFINQMCNTDLVHPEHIDVYIYNI